MNIDNPKLTAFALDELDESEKSAIALEVAASPEAQRVVDETREMARLLKNEFAAELKEKAKPRLSLSDIRDDSWFWAIARPLAVAAVLTVFALLGALVIGTYSRKESSRVATDYVVQAEQDLPKGPVNLPSLENIPNPVPANFIQRIDRVVIGEISNGPHGENEELRTIETIKDAYRVARLKQDLGAQVVSKKSSNSMVDRCYGLVFLDPNGRIVASARFCRSANSEFVLQPVKNAYEQGGRYFIGGTATLPGEWRSEIDYTQYVIQIPDWIEAIGYAPGA